MCWNKGLKVLTKLYNIMATETNTRKTLVFFGLLPDLHKELEDELNKTKAFGPETHVEVIRHKEGLVFRLDEGKRGYSFCRHVGDTDSETFRHFLHDPTQLQYMPIAYEVKEPSEAVVQGILERYQNYGARHAAKIDWIWFQREGRHLLLMRLPKEIIKGLMCRYGGTLSTQVRGPAKVLRTLPIISKIVPEEATDYEIMHRAFVTPYTASSETGTEYEQCLAIHQAAIQEIALAKPAGLSIGPTRWMP